MVESPLITAALLTAALSGGGHPVSPERDALPEELVRAVRSLQGGGVPDVAGAVPEVVEFGPEVVVGLLELLRHERVPELGGAPEQILSRYQEDLILRSLAEFGRESVAPAVDSLLGDPRTPGGTASALLALGAIGQSSDLRRIVQIALPDDVTQPDPRVARAFEVSLTTILRRDPRGFEHLSVYWQQVRLELLPHVIRAVGATSAGAGVDVLGQVIRWRPELAPLAVAQLRRMGPALEPSVNADLADQLRPRLDPESPDFCRAVILTLAELEDFHCVPRLIQLLDEPRGIGENAYWALRKLSGREWGRSTLWWERWYETEIGWYQNGHRQAQLRLASARQGTAAAALREYGEHRLFRHELAGEVEAVLYRTERTLRVLACETLATLGSHRSVPALIELATDDDPTVRAAAKAALQQLQPPPG